MSEVTFEPFQRVLVRNYDTQHWVAAFYSSNDSDAPEFPYRITGGTTFKQCLPYEGNEPLLGTTDNPTQPVPDFRFGDKVEVWDDGSQKWRKAIFLKMHMPYYFCLLDSEATCCWKHCRHADW